MSISRPVSFQYSDPVKRIHDSSGLQSFQQSLGFRDITIALTQIAHLVEGKDVPTGVLHKSDIYTPEEIAKYEHSTTLDISDDFVKQANSQLNDILNQKPIMKALVELMSRISSLIDTIPPLSGPRRYGNFACRQWHDDLANAIDEWLDSLIVPFYKLQDPRGFLKEIRWYILNAFGSRERLDYGTGHELNFLAFLTGLEKVGIISFNELDGYDFLVLFGVYYTLARKLISTYTLEPAGSHGVWGLDDHFHIIYILGSSQLLNCSDHEEISPKYTQNRSVVFQYSTRNLYFNAISFIFKVKKGSFFEHSPILYDVSNVKSWKKITKGMFKMFQAEVIGKFPVVQHFYFGGVLFPWVNALTLAPLPVAKNDAEEHVDDDKTPTPSTFNRSQEIHSESPVTTSAPWKSKRPQQTLQDAILSGTSSRTPVSRPQPGAPHDVLSTRAPQSKR